MADNVTANSGSGGAVFATDDISSVHYPIGKIAFGALNSATLVTSSDPFPVTVISISAGDNNIGNVDAIQSGTWNIGTVTAVTSITNALPAGTNAIGKLAANSGVDIGDVDVTSCALPTGASTLAEQQTQTTALQLIDNLVLLEDDAHSSGAPGVQLLTVRQNTAAALSGTNGDYQPLITDGSGRLFTAEGGALLTNSGTLAGTVFTEDSEAGGTETGLFILGKRDDALANTVSANGDYIGFRSNSVGAMWVAVNGTVTVGSHAVTNAGTFAVQESGGALTALQIIDDWDESDRAKVNVIVGQAGITAGAGAVAANTPRVTHASDDPVTTSVQLLDDTVFVDDAAFTPGASKAIAIALQADEASVDSVNEGDAGTPRMTLDRMAIVTVRPNASGEGLDSFRSLDIDETEEDVKTSAGKLYKVYAYNRSTGERFLKFYNLTAANTSVGSSTPKLTLPIPTNGTNGAGFTFDIGGEQGVTFDTAICVACTTGVADADTGAPGANDVIINVAYK